MIHITHIVKSKGRQKFAFEMKGDDDYPVIVLVKAWDESRAWDKFQTVASDWFPGLEDKEYWNVDRLENGSYTFGYDESGKRHVQQNY